MKLNTIQVNIPKNGRLKILFLSPKFETFPFKLNPIEMLLGIFDNIHKYVHKNDYK